MQGVHGRRRVGSGENVLAVPALRVGRADAADRLAADRARRPSYVRESEWEAAQSVWIWRERSASMGCGCELASNARRPSAGGPGPADAGADRGADPRRRARRALLGQPLRPASGRGALSRRFAAGELADAEQLEHGLPPARRRCRATATVTLIGDFFSPADGRPALARARRARRERARAADRRPRRGDAAVRRTHSLFEGLELRSEAADPERVESVREDYAWRPSAAIARGAGLRSPARWAGASWSTVPIVRPERAAP